MSSSVLCITLKFAPSLTEDTNHQAPKFTWNNGKMKIACNSAYVSRQKTLNFSFAWQAVIVYCLLYSFPPQTWLLSQRYNIALRKATICGDKAKMSE